VSWSLSNRVTTRTEGANITNLISAEPGLLGLASQSNSVEESILNKAIVAKKEPTEAIAVEMTLSLGQREPNLHWSETKTEQTFDALIEEGKLEEFESTKYQPTQKLSNVG
jgi:hypothetical protein